MPIIIRDFRPEDAEAVARSRRATVPFLAVTPRSVLFDVETANPAKRLRLLVAEEDGEILGTAYAGIAYDSDEPGQAYATPNVHPDRRGRGAGGLLLRAAEEHLAAHGAVSVYSWARDDPRSLAFARGRGYRPTRTAHFQHLDLAGAALPEPPGGLPPGVALRTAADYEDDPRPMFEADAEATSDEPSDIATTLDDFADWVAHTWNNPLLDRRLSTVVTVDGRVAAYTAAYTDGGSRYVSGMTGTLRAHRGRGLARLAKTDSLRRARAAGYTDAYTSNDGANAPMLAVNARLGYRVCATEVRHVRALG
ncbi:GNAT family N-acetyltransferase [Streptomyces sudanensis]|uniref:GNAT family N-acetyltransferase n=1 Tax=Streptomyces sudanensis TaxID=436397 RepID=UPI0020CEA044|nr:GNAT family N-acetyltransferase [Streptomyces sudanensis]MCP9959546.1 GNAT family N-acetyltransferase [Streptomyces sudanensis]MCQ0000016.1 GNAT family N-acetyltransferase [Streptomyces sudanensis]